MNDNFKDAFEKTAEQLMERYQKKFTKSHNRKLHQNVTIPYDILIKLISKVAE